jgi:AcrR family transcriptional regulator
LEPVSDPVVAERALRADAQRNLESILEAAGGAFAECGLEACVADIARRAGVGQATIFRRFETKDDLIAAVIERQMQKLQETAERAAGRKRAWDGLREFMEAATEIHIRDRGLLEAVHERMASEPKLMGCKARLGDIVGVLVERAKKEGDLRKDVTAQDFPLLVAAAAQAGTMAIEADPELWRRYLQIMLDGLRADGAHGRLKRATSRP